MSRYLWDTPDSLRALLCELVSWESQTFTKGEREFASKVQAKLMELDYFKNNPDQITLHDAGFGRDLVTAMYKRPDVKETIVLISHFDTVQTEEYGDLEPLAFHPEELTKELFKRKDDLPVEVRKDLESGKYLFGRGTMDMKMGLALHMAMIEKASVEQWPVNLLLVTVPDEEVNSAGMRAAVKELVLFREKYDISYKMFLNSEPTFTQEPGDTKDYIYTGTIGKIMPGALFYGKETHAGEPMKGITANYIASFLTQRMEWNSLFRESDLGESTPLPVSLQQKDLKTQYSTQTPYRAAALYNVFIFKRTADEVIDLFEQVAQEAVASCNSAYKAICEKENVEGVGTVRTIRYEELIHYAENKFGAEFIGKLKEETFKNTSWDDREKSINLVDKLMIQCYELAPAVVLFFAPPYYPAVNSSRDPLIINSVKLMKEVASRFNVEVNQIHYFNGICDLSYVNYIDEDDGWITYEGNTPVWGETYCIPFTNMLQLNAPVLNVGPFGKDPHQLTERLHINSAFIQMPVLLESLIKSMFPNRKNVSEHSMMNKIS
ncbi:M20/M25/M40 family metallo-hydrolase [Pseudalkalibacillus sp. A8]|uniref:M20/M25/M40 family metallo-hydrolase n=1 Tax=Pseudalkalibacillus sp. A8 TaxID=3382641 RepID=UPI0038B64E1C